MVKYRHRTWTDEQLAKAVANNHNMSGTLRQLNLRLSGDSYQKMKQHIDDLRFDTSHWYKKPKRPQRISDEDLFTKNSSTKGKTVKERVLKRQLIKYECSNCGINEWDDKELTLQLDHINGDSSDHRLENLRFLCPNCHSQTETWGMRGRPPKYCLDCGKCIKHQSTRCSSCANLAREYKSPPKIDWPSVSELLELLKTHSYVGLGEKLGVSDNAIRKHLKYSRPDSNRQLLL